MSSRTKKTTKTTTTTTSASASATPGSTPGSRSPGRQRPSSPTMISRLEEKNALVNLNDRLATYIDKVRTLENENMRLTTQIRAQEETISRETGNIKALYETELADARKLMDEMAKEKARLQIETGKHKADSDEWREKFMRADKDLNATGKRLLGAEGQVNDLQARLSDAINQRKHWEQEYNKLRTEVGSLEKQLAAAKKQLEEETMLRVDLQNRVQSLKEELAFNSQLHATELNETRTRTDVTIEEVDGRLHAEYDSRLAEALLQMRADAESTIRMTREETEESFLSKLDDLRSLAERGDRASMATREELRTCRRRIDELMSQNEGMKVQGAMFESRIRELESQLQREAEEHDRQIANRDVEIAHLREAIEEQLREYRDLMDVKIALDLEIAAYRKLLESEEDRLNISPGRMTPVRQTMSGRKRKRLADPLLGSSMVESHASNAFSATSSASGAIEVNETDTEGKFVKLFNTSDKELALGGWLLKHVAGDNETSFKFHRTLKVNPGSYVTVWSSDADATHSPPTDIVMKGQRWFVADIMSTVLINPTGDEMATRELKKTTYRTTTMTGGNTSVSMEGSLEQPRYRYQQEYAADRWGDGQRDEKCSIM